MTRKSRVRAGLYGRPRRRQWAAIQARPYAIGILLLLTAGSARAQTVLDNLDLTNATARTAHRVRVEKGDIHWQQELVGARTVPVGGARLQPGGSLRARLRAQAGATLLLTVSAPVKEYGQRAGWTVLLNGSPAASVVETDPGGGVSRSYFVPVPSAHFGHAEVEVDAAADSRAPVTVSTLRVYARLESGPKSPPAAGPMGLALLSRQEHGYHIDTAEANALARMIPASRYLDPQTAVLYNFCIRNAKENELEIDRLAAMALQSGVPLRIAFQVHWGGSPKGISDGAGGTFTDLPYQQITFDPDNKVEDAGLKALMGDRFDVRFGLTVPNRWGDTPWLTFNHPRLNQLRRIRLTQALTAWFSARERLINRGKGRLFPPQLSTGEETVYWAQGVDDRAYTAKNGGVPRTHLMADFNPFVVADAQRDGVYLDPRDGLDRTERWWLHQNLARQQQRIISWMSDAVPAEAIHLGPGGPSFAQDLTRCNLFTEPYAMPLFPLKEVSPYHPGLEVGYVEEGHSGGEYWSGAAMLPWLLKERERGRIALPNLECSGAAEPQLTACLRAAYACGARFATLYNWSVRPGMAAALKAFADSIDTPSGPAWPAAMPAPKGPLTRKYAAPEDAFGVNCVDLFPADAKAAPQLLRVRVRPSDGAEPSVTVTQVPAAEGDHWMLLLPTLYRQEPGRKYLLSVEAPGGASVPLKAAADGALAARLEADIRLERARSVAIEDWQDAADILSSLNRRRQRAPQPAPADEAVREAERLFAAAQPEDAYRAAVRAEQIALPANFHVPSPGMRLAPYDVTVLCPEWEVKATVTAYTRDSVSVMVTSTEAQTITVKRGPSSTSAALTPFVPAELTLELRPHK